MINLFQRMNTKVVIPSCRSWGFLVGIEPFRQSGDTYRKFVLDEGVAIRA